MEEPQPSTHRELVKRLHQAAETGDLQQIQALLNYNLEAGKWKISVEEGTAQLPFHGAAHSGHMELLPETLRHLIDTPIEQGGWSCVHCAAAHGHVRVVQWLCAEGMADLNVKAKEGNTPMHLAVVLGRKDVVRFLVTAGANLFSLNNQNMMPFSLCKDPGMFEALFSNYTSGSTSFNRARSPWPLDAEDRSFLHYTAQFARDTDGIVNLISELDMAQLQGRDKRGDTFLHVAAKSGNMQVLEALRKADVDVNGLVSTSRSDLNPGLCALLNNQQDFFDALIGISTVTITLRCIIQGLMAELIDKPEIFIDKPEMKDRLGLFADTLPTYLALYANKKCIFTFLLETKIINLSQWDDEQKMTCLHWAIFDNRIDIVKYLSGNAQVRPGMQDADGKTVLKHAFYHDNHMIMDILRSKRVFKEYEEKLDRDREIYVQALNAILVSAALIASVTFAGWLQLPSTDFYTLGMKVFWASNCVSFFTAVATMCVTTTALIPTRKKYVGDIVNQLHVAIVMDAGLLALSLAAVMWAFAAAGFAALHDVQTFSNQGIMRITAALGGLLCFMVWIAFVVQLYKCAPQRSVLFALVFPSVPPSLFSNGWCPPSFQRVRTRIGESSRFGYLTESRKDLRSDVDKDLVALRLAREPPPGMSHVPCIIPLETMQHILGKLDHTGMSSFFEQTYKQKEDEIARKKRKEGVNASIIDDFNINRTVASPNYKTNSCRAEKF